MKTFRLPNAASCRITGDLHERRVMRDAAGAVDFEYCAACGARRYRDPEAGALSAWAADDLWRYRFHARRIFEAMVAAAQATHPRGHDAGRREAIALVAQWFGTETVGSWYAWTRAQCETMHTNAAPLLRDYADLLVTGGARHLLHLSRARASWFPRLTYRWLVVRDAVRHALTHWIATWRA